MVNVLRRVAAFWFFLLGFLAIAGVLLMKRELLSPPLVAVVHVLDLPLLFSGIVFGGTSLYRSMVPEGKSSPVLAILIAIPLLAVFCVFAYFNFALPFSDL
ncbi:MAG TPA: hypothetical protein PKV72_02355 [Candidatus Peribacteria bacterium]|nr:hypothetical protein [Candidatus Peribacteria bacterium]